MDFDLIDREFVHARDVFTGIPMLPNGWSGNAFLQHLERIVFNDILVEQFPIPDSGDVVRFVQFYDARRRLEFQNTVVLHDLGKLALKILLSFLNLLRLRLELQPFALEFEPFVDGFFQLQL